LEEKELEIVEFFILCEQVALNDD